jgi:hypothetical protein
MGIACFNSSSAATFSTRRCLCLVFVLMASTVCAGDDFADGYAADDALQMTLDAPDVYSEEQFAHSESDSTEQCAQLLNEAPEDINSGFPTFVAALPSVVLDLSRCSGTHAEPRINLAAHLVGARASAMFTQGGFNASAVIDGIADEPDNGWAYFGHLNEAILTITFDAVNGAGSVGGVSSDGAGTSVRNVKGGTEVGDGTPARVLAGRIVIVSGIGRGDHHLTSFRLWASEVSVVSPKDATSGEGEEGSQEAHPAHPSQTSEGEEGETIEWRKIPGLSCEKADIVVGEDGVSVWVKAGVGEVMLDFPPLQIRSLRLKVDSSDAESGNNNAIINEIEVRAAAQQYSVYLLY